MAGGIVPKRVDTVIYQYAAWDRVQFFADALGNPIDTTGWTGRLRLMTEYGPSGIVQVNTTATPYTLPGTTVPSGMRMTIPASTTGSLNAQRYPRLVGDLMVVTVPGADPDRAVEMIAVIDPGTGAP